MRTMIVREEQVSSIAFLKADATPLLVVVARMTIINATLHVEHFECCGVECVEQDLTHRVKCSS